MNRCLRIAVADDELRMREFYLHVLPLLGHEVICLAEDGRQLVDHCRNLHPQLVIADIKMPFLDGIDAARQINKFGSIPFILVSAHDDPGLIQRAGNNHILAYLIKPIKKQDLQPAITIAWHRFEEFEAMRRESASLKQALQDRKVIERAKGIIMRRMHLGEDEAFKALQELARDKNRKLIDVAEMVVTVEDAFGWQ